ncbi:MAG: arginase [Paenibacillaceae bacterium]|nr:arginase [Paenibacillaceae bacterium]
MLKRYEGEMVMQADRLSAVAVLGVPLELGAGRAGTSFGPDAIRRAGLQSRLEALGLEVSDEGDITVASALPSQQAEENPLLNMKHAREIIRVNRILSRRVSALHDGGRLPLILGGDHSLALGTIAGAARSRGRIGVIWIDAHGDVNTADTSPSGNVHGMPLAAALGYGHRALTAIGGRQPLVRPENVVLIGVRSLDPGERSLLRQTGVTVFTMPEIDRHGMAFVMEQAIAMATRGTSGVHLSFDMDSLDPLHAPGVGTPVAGGLTIREAHLAMELLAAARVVGSADLVEVNPLLDDGNRSAELAVDLAASLFGETIL